MILKALTLENFKGIREPVRIEFAPLTLLFGPNNAGKSTIIQALIYAREIFERGNIDPRTTEMGGDSIDLGGFKNMVYGRDLTKEIRMRFELDGYFFESFGSRGGDYWQQSSYFGPILSSTFPEYDDLIETSFESGSAPDARDYLCQIHQLWVEIVIAWSSQHQRPVVRSYRVGSQNQPDVIIPLEYDDASGRVRCELANLGTIPFGAVPDGERFVNALRRHISTLDSGLTNEQIIEGVQCESKPSKSGFKIRLSTQCLWASLGFPLSWLAEYGYASGFGINVSSPWIEDQLPNELPTELRFRNLTEGVLSQSQNNVVHFIERIIAMTVSESRAALWKLLKDSIYLSSNRVTPTRDSVSSKLFDSRRWPDGRAAWDLLQIDGEDLVRKVSHWLSDPKKFNSGFNIVSRSYRRVDLSGTFSHYLTQLPLLKEHVELSIGAAEIFNNELIIDAFKLFSNAITDIKREWEAEPIETEFWFERLNEYGNTLAVPLQDMGSGMTHLLPVIVAALLPQPLNEYGRRPFGTFGIVAIEEPEAKVHPAFQMVIADLFITQAKLDDDIGHPDGTMFLVETHSEHLMLRCLRRIRETSEGEVPEGEPSLKPEDIAVHFVEPGDDGPRIHRIRIGEDGEFLDPWPRGFFRERSKEIYGDDL